MEKGRPIHSDLTPKKSHAMTRNGTRMTHLTGKNAALFLYGQSTPLRYGKSLTMPLRYEKRPAKKRDMDAICPLS